MKSQFKLKKYQEKKANSIYEDIYKVLSKNGDPKAIVLEAPTGAGKTIMLISIAESIYKGIKEEFNIIWVSESPDLNKQSKIKFEKFSDIISSDNLEIITKDTFSGFGTNTIYFLNYSKLSKSSSLSKPNPDKNRDTIWKELEHLKVSEQKTVLIIDEAHKGTTRKFEDKDDEIITDNDKKNTILQEIISKLKPDVVLGVSATPRRFIENMINQGYDDHEEHIVLKEEVIKSGMVKSRIINKTENKSKHDFSQLLISEAIKDYDIRSDIWIEAQKNKTNKLEPILLIQINKEIEEGSDFQVLINYILESKNITEENIFNSIGDHQDKNVRIGDKTITIPYILPNDIDKNENVKAVIFKEALEEGWDCPRADMILSFRVSHSDVKITQTVGRVLRNPFHETPEITEAYPELDNVIIYTSNYNPEVMKRIEEEFGQKPEHKFIDNGTTEINASLRHEVKTDLELVKLPTYIRIKNEGETLIDKISNIAKIKGLHEDDVFEEVIQLVITEHIAKINAESIKDFFDRSIKEYSKKLNSDNINEDSHYLSISRSGYDISKEFYHIYKKEDFILDDLLNYTKLNLSLIEFEQETLIEINKLQSKGLRRETISQVILLSCKHLLSKIDRIIQLMTRTYNSNNGLVEDISKIYSDPNEYFMAKNKETIKSENLRESDRMTYSTGRAYYGNMKTESRIEGKFLDSIDNKNYKWIHRNTTSNSQTSLGIPYRKNSGKKGLFYPDFICKEVGKPIEIVETKGINMDPEWKNKLIGLIDYLEDYRAKGNQLKFRFILEIKERYFEINDTKVSSFIDGINEESLLSGTFSNIKEIEL